MRPWAEIEASPEFQGASDDDKLGIRQRFLDRTFQENPKLPEDQRVRIIGRVFGGADPGGGALDDMQGQGFSSSEPGPPSGFFGQAAGKVGRTALKIADAPFIPLHYLRDKVVKPALDFIPGLNKPFQYRTLDPALADKFVKEKNMTPAQADVAYRYGLFPAEAYTQREGPTRSEVLSHGMEIAATGSYITNVIGNLARYGFTPAVRYIDKALQNAKVIDKWSARKVAFERAGRFFHDRKGAAESYGATVFGKWNDKLADAAKRKEVRDVIEQGIEDIVVSDPVKASLIMGKLDPSQQEVLGWYIGRDQARRKLGVDLRIMRTPQEGYVSHVVEELEAAKKGVLFQLHRQNKLTLQELEALGKKDFIEDIAIADAIHEVAFQKLVAKSLFTKMMTTLKASDGSPAVISQLQLKKLQLKDPAKAEQYIYANPRHTGLEKQMNFYGFRKAETVDSSAIEGSMTGFPQAVYVHPEYYKQVRRFMPPLGAETATSEYFKRGIHASRRMIMYNPLIHGVNITSTVVAAAPWGNVSKIIDFFIEGGKAKSLGMKGVEPYISDLMEAAHDGLRIPSLSAAWHNIAQDGMKVAKIPKSFIGKLSEANDRILFDTIVSNPMMGMYKQVKDRWTPILGKREAGKVAAEYVNTNQGAIPLESFSPFMQRFGQWILFSRSWTLSNFRTLAHSVGIPMATRHLKPEAQAALAQEWAETWSRSLAYTMIHNELMNKAIAGHSSMENPAGHEFDIDTGRYDKKGRRVYIAGSPFLYVRQMAKLAGHIAEGDANAVASDLIGKLGVWKGGVESAINYDAFLRRPLVKEGAPLSEQISRKLIHAAAGLTPFGSTVRELGVPGAEFGESVREIVTDPLEWLRLLTYWKAHGMTYHTEVFTRLKRADQNLIMNNMSPEAKQGLIRGVALGKIEGTAALELKALKDKITYYRERARDEAMSNVMRGDIQKAAEILTKAGWSIKGAKTFIETRGRKTGLLDEGKNDN